MTEETKIKKDIKQYLILNHWFLWHNLQRLGSYPGIPDIIAIRNGIVLFIEAKTEKGKLSPHQKKFKANIENHGGNFVVATKWEDLKKWNKVKK